MKKILSFAAVSLLSLTMFAAPVSPEKALQVAGKFFGDGGVRASALTIVWTGNEAGTRSAAAEAPALYAINRAGGGFVIVAGDDNARPILGFSQEGRFAAADMPAHVAEWMRGLKLYCRQAAAGPATADIAVLWEAFDPATRGSMIDDTVTDEYTASQTLAWGQSGYNSAENFNIYCPWDETASKRSVTGCLPLALAEIIAWQSLHGYSVPTTGTGTVGGYAAQAGYYAPAAYDLSTSTYQWDLFNTRDAVYMYYSASDAEKQAVSRVTADFGAALQAQYSAGFTGSSDGDVIKAFGDHFSYSKDAVLRRSDSYSLREWKDMLKTEIKITPMLYSGQSRSAVGHAFVLDGFARYLEEDVFHINFGWFGNCNGYYFLPDLDTSSSSDGSENWAYGSPTTIFGFLPDPLHTTEYGSPSLTFFNNGSEEGGLSVSTAQIVRGTPFNVTIKLMINNGPTNYSGPIELGLYDKNGVLKAALAGMNLEDMVPGSYYPEFSANNMLIDTDLAFGDYIELKYLPAGQTDLPENYLPVKGSSNGQILTRYPVYGAAFIDTSGSPTVGNPYALRLKNAAYAYNGPQYSTSWTVTFPNGARLVVPGDDAVFTPTAAGTYHITATVTNPGMATTLEIIEADLVVN